MDRRRPHAAGMSRRYDVAVVGAGCFGAWCAWHLTRAGRRVVLLDAYGPGNTRSSSGGETRIIRMGYGADEIYTLSSVRSLELWRSVFRETEESLFRPTGVLWLAPKGHTPTLETVAALARLGVAHEVVEPEELRARYPQMRLEEGTWGLVEPHSGVLMARRAVQVVADDAVRRGCELRRAAVLPLDAPGTPHLDRLAVDNGPPVEAESFVFACGPWLPKVLPDVLGGLIFPTRQEVFFFGTPAGDRRFSPEELPTWIDFGIHEAYGMPDLDGRGFKVALDRHGPPFDPDHGDRLVPAESVVQVRAFLERRFPALADAPLLETRVCQYENTSSGDFVIDRHPVCQNVWIAGGGSGHGFKHGPAVGEHLAARLLESAPAEPRYALASKSDQQRRVVF
jgi:monomeric sarcosine oxidase